jgi:tight adherence protein C
MGKSHSAIGDELSMVVLEQHAGCPRSDAWRHFADRTDVRSVRSLVSMMAQSEKFGTSVAKALRVHSESLRTQRVQQVSEQAAKTTVKMLFPLVLCIFPSVFIVVLGTALIQILGTLHSTIIH